MIESQLTQYGVFGLWTLFNIYIIKYLITQNAKREDEVLEVVKNNTAVISKFLERTR